MSFFGIDLLFEGLFSRQDKLKCDVCNEVIAYLKGGSRRWRKPKERGLVICASCKHKCEPLVKIEP